jgi:hypothetical protein
MSEFEGSGEGGGVTTISVGKFRYSNGEGYEAKKIKKKKKQIKSMIFRLLQTSSCLISEQRRN